MSEKIWHNINKRSVEDVYEKTSKTVSSKSKFKEGKSKINENIYCNEMPQPKNRKKTNSASNAQHSFKACSGSTSNGAQRDCGSLDLENWVKPNHQKIKQESSMKMGIATANLQHNEPKEISSMSSMSAGVVPSPASVQSNNKYQQMKQDLVTEQRLNSKKIDSYVKDHLSKNLKFIPSGEMMMFSEKQRSLCQKVCRALNVLPADQQIYWNLYSRCVEKSINAARNDAVAALKKSFFKGKLPCFMCVMTRC